MWKKRYQAFCAGALRRLMMTKAVQVWRGVRIF
ncbi:hypothetical protein SAMN05216168_3720 [Kosakonia radicincitans]|nr:hypothetical protein SAMN05216168_3720 [Kosakonia radicincitans]